MPLKRQLERWRVPCEGFETTVRCVRVLSFELALLYGIGIRLNLATRPFSFLAGLRHIDLSERYKAHLPLTASKIEAEDPLRTTIGPFVKP